MTKNFEPAERRISAGLWWDRAWSLVEGCQEIATGCLSCWSRSASYMREKRTGKLGRRYEGLTEKVDVDGRVRWTGRVVLQYGDLEKPTTVKKPTVFSIWNDLFHPTVTDRFLRRVVWRIRENPRHIFIALTKRPELIRARMDLLCSAGENPAGLIPDISTNGLPPENLWVGVSASDQETLETATREFSEVAGAFEVALLSLEPLVGVVDLETVRANEVFSWIIAGCETGPNARSTPVASLRYVREYCAEYGIPFFLKKTHDRGGDDRRTRRELDGRTFNGFPFPYLSDL